MTEMCFAYSDVIVTLKTGFLINVFPQLKLELYQQLEFNNIQIFSSLQYAFLPLDVAKCHMQGLTIQCVIFSSNSLSKCPYWMVYFFLCSKSETQSLVAPPVFQFAKSMDLFIKLSRIARASRLALSPSRLLSQWMNNCNFSLCLYDVEPHGEEQHNRPALNRLCMKTNCGSLQPRE